MPKGRESSKRKKRRMLHMMQDGKCFYCEEPISLDEATSDHVFPESFGYLLVNNHVVACHDCNCKKGDDIPCIDIIKKAIALYQKFDLVFYPITRFEIGSGPFLSAFFVFKNCGIRPRFLNKNFPVDHMPVESIMMKMSCSSVN